VKTVRFGTVDSVRPVTLPGKDSGAGALVGAVAGGLGGAEIGKGRGAAVGAVIGTVAGSLAGAALEDHLTRREALEIIVELDNTGELRAITQEISAQTFHPGDRVRLVTGGGITRVEKLAQD
jgi:outer membrane lipoprotein SlyB